MKYLVMSFCAMVCFVIGFGGIDLDRVIDGSVGPTIEIGLPVAHADTVFYTNGTSSTTFGNDTFHSTGSFETRAGSTAIISE